MHNKCQLIGNLGKDPEVRTLTGGKKVANFSLATSESYKDKNGEKQTKTEWHNIIVWEKLAEICEKYIKKGSKIFLEGRITYREFDDKDGVKRRVTDIVCSEMRMLDGAGNKEKPAPAEKPAKQKTESGSSNEVFDHYTNQDDDLPF